MDSLMDDKSKVVINQDLEELRSMEELARTRRDVSLEKQRQHRGRAESLIYDIEQTKEESRWIDSYSILRRVERILLAHGVIDAHSEIPGVDGFSLE